MKYKIKEKAINKKKEVKRHKQRKISKEEIKMEQDK
jgi:hypothetical protein